MTTGTTRDEAGHAGAWRADIDGLRAIAVLSVVAYHYFPLAWQGGFIGVDIFFVLSGYLITGILLSARGHACADLLDFYARRMRRIFPALAVVLCSVMLLGALVLYHPERAALGKQVTGGAAFLSNILLWRESGYFDAAIEAKPLAHLWSLGVEEQFYMLWPLVLWQLTRSRYTFAMVAALLAASLVACGWMSDFEQPAAFYLPVFRFWELLAGGLLVLAARRGLLERLRPHANALSAAGFAVLAFGFLLVHSGLRFPGWWALLPVVGTCLVVAAGPEALANRTVLSTPSMVFVGKISYPLYLWHWPLLTIARITFQSEPDARGMLLLASVSLVLAWLTWRFVERPIRAPGFGGRKAAVLSLMMAAIAVGGLVLRAPASGRLGDQQTAYHLPRAPAAILATDPLLVPDCRMADPQQRVLVRHCLRDRRGAERFALVGDSKAEALYDGLVQTSTAAGRWLFVGGASAHSSMIPVLSDAARYRGSQLQARLTLDTVAVNPRIETVAVVIATRNVFQLPGEASIEALPSSPDPADARDGLARFVAKLVAAGKRVVLIVDNPTLRDIRICITPPRLTPPVAIRPWFTPYSTQDCSIPWARHLELSSRYRTLLEQIRATAPERIMVFDTLPYLCDARTGMCAASDEGGALYSYSDHISDRAARRIGAALNSLLAGDRPSITTVPSP